MTCNVTNNVIYTNPFNAVLTYNYSVNTDNKLTRYTYW